MRKKRTSVGCTPKARQRVACYVRVSTADKQTTESQRLEIRRWLKSQNINSDGYKWYEDKQTGTNNERPALQRLMGDVDKGRVTTVVVFKLDRLARNMRLGLETLEFLTEHGCRIVATSQNLDFSGAVGILVRNLLMAVSEFEVETRRERVRAGVANYRAKNGKWGRPKNVKRYAQVKRLRDKGLSVEHIALRLDVTRQAVYYSLRRAKNCLSEGSEAKDVCFRGGRREAHRPMHSAFQREEGTGSAVL